MVNYEAVWNRSSSGRGARHGGIPQWLAGLAQAAHFVIYATLTDLVIAGLITTYLWFGMSIAHRVLTPPQRTFSSHVAF